MEVEPAKPTFEAIILFKRIPYWLYWPVVGIISFVLGELLIWAYAEKNLFYTLLILSISLGTLPLINMWFFNSFKRLMHELSEFFWDNNEEFEKWYKIKEKYIFTLNSLEAKFTIGFIFIIGLVTVILLGLPFKSEICNITGVNAFALLLIFCGNTLWISIGLLLTLEEIVKRPIKIPFFMIRHHVVSKLKNYYLTQTLFLVLYYIGLVIAVWQGPYGFNYAMLGWLTGVAFYPLVLFLWSFFKIHFLMNNIKQSYLEIINSEVQHALNNVLSNHNLKDTEHLEKIMSIQDKIHTLAEWPISFSSSLTFLMTLITAITQILVSAYLKQ
jgi:hypothetical protein